MKIYSKTIGQEIEVDTMEKEQNGQVMTVIKHASLMDVIYNQLDICKDPECIKIEDARPHSPYPVYRCTIWDKERQRVAIGIGSGKPETLTAGIAADYADESASNRAFDRAAITYLQFPGRQLSEEEVGIFLPEDITAAIPNVSEEIDIPYQQGDLIDSSPVEPIASAPISSVEVEPEIETMEPFMNAPIEEEPEVSVPDVNGDVIIDFGKYQSDPKKLSDIVATEDGLEWAKRCTKIKAPKPSIVDQINTIKTYLEANGLMD